MMTEAERAAVRAATIEECAKVAIRHTASDANSIGFQDFAERIAEEIRALAAQPAAPSQPLEFGASKPLPPGAVMEPQPAAVTQHNRSEGK